MFSPRMCFLSAILAFPLSGVSAQEIPPAPDNPLQISNEPWVPYESCIPCEPCRQQPYGWVDPRFSVRHDFGDGVGYDNGFTYFEAFVPIWQQSRQSLIYGDARVVNFDHQQFWEFNVGGGYRWYNCCSNRIWGANLFYDGRNSDRLYYNQIGFGIESLGQYVDFRANGYVVVGDDESLIGFSNPHFQGHRLLFDRNEELAWTGMDFEVGVPVPGLENYDTRAYLGYYFYTHNNIDQDIHGISGRIESRLSETLTLHFSVNHDRVFDTTVNGGLAFHFGGGRLAGGWGFRRKPVAERLDERVVRDPNIVLSQEEAQEEEIINPATGQPYFFLHVAPDGNSNGSFENPYPTLGEAFSDPRFAQGNVVVYDRTAGTFTGDVHFANNTQLLSNSPVQYLDTVQAGRIQVPLSGAGGPLPTINGHVVMTPGGVLSGFNVYGQGQSAAVQIMGHGDFRILNNVITNIGEEEEEKEVEKEIRRNGSVGTLPNGNPVDIAGIGIFGSGFSGSVEVANTDVNSFGDALYLAPMGANIHVTESNLTSFGNNGVSLLSYGNDNVGFHNSHITGAFAGIGRLESYDNSTLVASFENSIITGTANGISSIGSFDNSSLTAQFFGNTIDGPGGDALSATSADTSTLCLNAMNNTLQNGTGTDDFGFDLNNFGGVFNIVDRDNLGANNNGATVDFDPNVNAFMDVLNCP